jgi:tRNA A37 threonylcarbamoyladenosine dehydratase
MHDDARFGGIERLFGSEALERLRRAHVCVVGIGGVGSWSVEALARSGVGALTLVDLDEVCLTNVNRQLHAVAGEIGRPKVEAMARRVNAIHPACAVTALHTFFTPVTAEETLRARFDYVLDAIDSPANKSLLIAGCCARQIPVITVGAAGGRQEATSLQITDLARSSHDRLLVQVRSILRKEHGFPPADKPFGVDCVFSTKPPVFPRKDGGVRADREPGTTLRLDCETGFGTACFVTGAFGFAAAGHIVRKLVVRSRS